MGAGEGLNADPMNRAHGKGSRGKVKVSVLSTSYPCQEERTGGVSGTKAGHEGAQSQLSSMAGTGTPSRQQEGMKGKVADENY